MSPLRSLPWWLAFAAACVVTTASAQEVDAGYYDGSWTAHLPCRSGQGTPEVHTRHSAPPGAGDLRPATAASAGAANGIRLERR